MNTRKRLGSLVMMLFALMTPPPIVRTDLGKDNFESDAFESRGSYCQGCINREEERCLSNGLATRFPSGTCGNYEPPGDWETSYNITFGPLIEGVFRGPKIIDTRPSLGYTEIEAEIQK